MSVTVRRGKGLLSAIHFLISNRLLHTRCFTASALPWMSVTARSVIFLGTTYLAYVRDGFALTFLNISTTLLPEIGDSEDAIGAFDHRVKRVFVVEIPLDVA